MFNTIDCKYCQNKTFEKLDSEKIYQRYNFYIEDNFIICTTCGGDNTTRVKANDVINLITYAINNFVKFDNKFLTPSYFI